MAHRIFDVISGCRDVAGQEEASEDGLVQILFQKLVNLANSASTAFPALMKWAAVGDTVRALMELLRQLSSADSAWRAGRGVTVLRMCATTELQ